MKKFVFLFIAAATVLLSSCGSKVPQQYGRRSSMGRPTGHPVSILIMWM